MSASSPEISDSAVTSTSGQLDATEHVTIAPDQVIAMLIKSNHINLRGFGGVTQKLPFWVPQASGFTPKEVDIAVNRTRKTTDYLLWAGGFLWVALTVFYVFNSQVLARLEPGSGSKASWTVKSVQAQGITLSISSGDQAAVIQVPLGAMLPSGELLRSVDQALQSFSTDSQITVVKK